MATFPHIYKGFTLTLPENVKSLSEVAVGIGPNVPKTLMAC